jgi:hypothetical protein
VDVYSCNVASTNRFTLTALPASVWVDVVARVVEDLAEAFSVGFGDGDRDVTSDMLPCDAADAVGASAAAADLPLPDASQQLFEGSVELAPGSRHKAGDDLPIGVVEVLYRSLGSGLRFRYGLS